MLEEAAPFGLVIYGSEWERTPWAQYARGPLPFGDLAAAYCSATVALGITVPDQKALGMVNNRVFDVLASGGFLVSDSFPAVEELLPEPLVHYHRQPGDTAALIRRATGNPEWRQGVVKDAAEHVSAAHMFSHRVQQLLDVYGSVGGRDPSLTM